MKRLAISILLLLSGCAALGGRKPVIENRFTRYTYGSDQNSIGIAVSTSDLAKPDAGVSLTSLSDRGQAALIDQTKGKPPTTIKALAGDDAVVAVRNTVSRHIVLAVRQADFLPPGDRVDAIRISLEVASPTPPKWEISSWTQASNGQSVIDLGKLTDTSSSKVTASSSVKAVKFLPDLTVGGENDQTSAREVEIKDTTDFDAAVDSDGKAWLDETAGWRQSLAHNLSMDVLLVAPATSLRPSGVVSLSKLAVDDPKKKGGTLRAKPQEVRLLEGSVYAPLDYEAQPICGWATLTYRIRHVSNAAARTFSESDDVVEFRTGTAYAPFLFAPPPYKPGYVIRSSSGVLSYQMEYSPPASMIFPSLESATAFRDWLRQSAPTGGHLANATIGFDVGRTNVQPLTSSQYRNLVPAIENASSVALTASPEVCRTVDLRPKLRADTNSTPQASGEKRRKR